MENSFIFNEAFTNGFKVEFLDITYLGSILAGILVITSKNPVVSVLCLIGLFLNISCYLLVLGINFIGLSYLLVYVGAVSILFLFILMLINVRISELSSDTSNSILLAVIIGVSFNYALYQILPYSIGTSNLSNLLNDIIYNNKIITTINRPSVKEDNMAFVTSNTWDGSLSETSHITSIGNIMYTSHSMWLIITSIILLLAMVGAIVITIKQKS